LLAYLALSERSPQPRRILAAFLWPDRSETEALDSLRYTLSHLRAALEDRQTPDPVLQVSRNEIGLHPQAQPWVDALEFERLAAACEAQASGEMLPPPPALQAALALYRGPFLQGFSIDDSPEFKRWALDRREHFERLRLRLLHLLAASCEQACLLQQAEAACQAVLAAQPLDEAAQRRLARLQARSETPAVQNPAPNPRARTPFVARQRELAGLGAALDRALSGQGQVALVTGEPGSGKTTLLSEFARQALHHHPDLLVVGGHSNAYSGVGQPYLPFIESLQMLAGEWDPLPWANSLDQAHQLRLQAALPWVARTLAETAPSLLEHFIGRTALIQRLAQVSGARPAWLTALQRARPPGSAQGGLAPLEMGALYEQYTRLVIVLARQSPLVLLLDDLQWVDPGSISLLFHLARRSPNSPVLIVAAYRSGEIAAQAGTSAHPLHGMVAELRSLFGSTLIDLDQTDEQAFVAAYLDQDPLLQPQRLEAAFRLALARHTGGNPLFLAELLRYLKTAGALQRAADGAWTSRPELNWQRLPERIEAAIATRIARLPEPWIDWLTTASVEGDSFTAEVVSRVHDLDERILLNTLSGPLNVSRGAHRLLQFEGVQWVEGQRRSLYRFRHALFRTYLYERMSAAERSQRHAAVGQALETLHTHSEGLPGAYASQLARHFEAAGLAERAAGYWLQASRHAIFLAAAPMAIAGCRRGLALLAGQPDSPARDRLSLQLNLGLAAALMAASEWAGEERGAALQQALQGMQRFGSDRDLPELFPLLFIQVNWLILHSQLLQAAALAERMLEMAGEQPGLQLALACWSAGACRLFLADFPAARAAMERGLAVYEAAGRPPTLGLVGTDLTVMCQAWLALLLLWMGFPDQAWQRILQARRRAEQIGKNLNLGAVMVISCNVAVYRGDLLTAVRLSTELLQMTQELETPLLQGLALLMHGRALAAGAAPHSPQAQAGADAFRQGGDLLGRLDAAVISQMLSPHVAAALLKIGQIDAGLALLQQASEVIAASGLPDNIAAELFRAQAELLLAASPAQPEQAEALLLRSLQASRQAGALMWELEAALSLGRLWKADRPLQARRLLAEVYGRFTEGWQSANLQAARALLDELDQSAACDGYKPDR
ncbi:MAG: ATP-binding protein, partial [Chloroflexota bacterium]